MHAYVVYVIIVDSVVTCSVCHNGNSVVTCGVCYYGNSVVTCSVCYYGNSVVTCSVCYYGNSVVTCSICCYGNNRDCKALHTFTTTQQVVVHQTMLLFCKAT